MVYSVSLSIQQTDENNYVVFGLFITDQFIQRNSYVWLNLYGFKADRNMVVTTVSQEKPELLMSAST